MADIETTRGHIVFALAETLINAGMDVAWSMHHAIDSVAAGRCTDELRAKIGDEAANALDLDLAENLAAVAA